MCGFGEKNPQNPKNRGYRGSDNADKVLHRHSVTAGNAHKTDVLPVSGNPIQEAQTRAGYAQMESLMGQQFFSTFNWNEAGKHKFS